MGRNDGDGNGDLCVSLPRRLTPLTSYYLESLSSLRQAPGGEGGVCKGGGGA